MIEGWAPCDLCMPHVMLMHACVVPAGSSLLSSRSEASAGSLYWIASPGAHVLCRQVQACFRYAAKPVPDRFTGSLCRIALHSLDLRSLYASMYRALVAASAVGRERALSASPQADVMPHRSTLSRLAACATVAGKYMLPALRAFTAECIALGDCLCAWACFVPRSCEP